MICEEPRGCKQVAKERIRITKDGEYEEYKMCSIHSSAFRVELMEDRVERHGFKVEVSTIKREDYMERGDAKEAIEASEAGIRNGDFEEDSLR